ncbi:MAG TPA: aminotransferase class I/II-fold pyridoxal phosphate-dependent enzyme [Candidatus Baltobacteraceae bacterium]|nr:aminotransferase class I/II-fold pyridoxal phosphate-dependent enzyme [Candidatus Baltobacteraceae bacterium]
MSEGPRPAPAIAALPASRPFVAPEELALRAGHESLLRLGANESAFGPPPAALEAMQADLATIAWYGDPESNLLRAALAVRHACAAENIAVGAGSDDLMGLCVRGYLAPGEVSVCAAGTYPTYAYHVTGYGGQLETVAYEEDGRVPLEKLAAAARHHGAKVAYLANPDNPSGSFAGRAAVEAFRAALPSETLLVLDEAYADFVEPHELLPDQIDPGIVRLRTFSKAYGLAGARVGYALAAPDVIATFSKIRLQYGVGRLSQSGALAALEAIEFVAGVVREVARGRDEYHALGKRLGLATLPSLTNFVCFDLGSRARAETLVDDLLRRAVFVRKPGAPPLDRFVRVTVGTQAERERFAGIFAAALEGLTVRALV